MFEIAVKISI